MRGGWNHKAQGFVLWSVGIKKLKIFLVFITPIQLEQSH